MAALHHLRGIDEVFGDAPPPHKAGLIFIDQERNLPLKTRGKPTTQDLDIAVLE